MVDITYIRTILKLNGLDSTKYTDEELTILYNYKKEELENLVGFHISPKKYIEYANSFCNTFFVTNHYPIITINKFKFDEEDITKDIKIIDYKSGIIYFTETKYAEYVKLVYTVGLSNTEQEKLIKPLIIDMMAYSLKYGYNAGITSTREGDISVNYDSSANLGASINNKIQDLKNRYGYKIKLL